MARCEDCHKLISGTPKKSILGRTQCARCNGMGLAGPAGAVGGGVAGGIAARGWFAAIHDTIHGKNKKK